MTNQINQADHAIHKIGVISDTHGLLRENVMDILRTCGTAKVCLRRAVRPQNIYDTQ